MQASVAAEIRWRLDLFAEVLGSCRRGGFSFARFLALVPDRLRLAGGDRADRVRVPLAVDPELYARLKASLPGATPPPGGDPRPAGRAELRRFLRLAQVHPDVDVVELQAWSTTGAPAMLDTLARAYARGLSELGRGEGGLEAIYLVHLALIDATRRALDARGAEAGPRALVAATLPQAFARAVETSEVRAEALPTRLAMQAALTTSFEALGLDARSWARRPCNPRRTLEEAVELARRVVTPPFETMPVERVVDTVARRLLAEPKLAAKLCADMLAEQIRDACLLLAGSLSPSDAEEAVEVASSSRALTRAVHHEGRRRALLAWAKAGPASGHRAGPVLAGLLAAAPAVVAGDPAPLGVHGDLAGRAKLAARGAVLAALDAHAEELRKDVSSVIAPVPPEAQRETHRAGRCYRLALDDAPLYHLPDPKREAALLVDLGAVGAALAGAPARRVAGLLDRHLLGPLLARLAVTPGVERAGLTADLVIARGPVEGLVEVAQDHLQRLAELRRAARSGPADVFGGRPEVEVERAEELARIDARLVQLDQAISKASADPESVRLLSDSKAMLEGRRARLGEAAIERTGEGPVVSAAITFGEVAEALPGCPEVAISGPMVAGRALLERTPWLSRARASRLAMTREARGDPQVDLPFAVSLGHRDGQPGLYNAGCALTDGAREALEAALPGVRVEERMVELRALPAGLRARHVFELDPEHLRALIGADDRVVVALRRVGELDGQALWELLPAGLELVEACFGPAREAAS